MVGGMQPHGVGLGCSPRGQKVSWACERGGAERKASEDWNRNLAGSGRA